MLVCTLTHELYIKLGFRFPVMIHFSQNFLKLNTCHNVDLCIVRGNNNPLW